MFQGLSPGPGSASQWSMANKIPHKNNYIALQLGREYLSNILHSFDGVILENKDSGITRIWDRADLTIEIQLTV